MGTEVLNDRIDNLILGWASPEILRSGNIALLDLSWEFCSVRQFPIVPLSSSTFRILYSNCPPEGSQIPTAFVYWIGRTPSLSPHCIESCSRSPVIFNDTHTSQRSFSRPKIILRENDRLYSNNVGNITFYKNIYYSTARTLSRKTRVATIKR